MFKVMKMVDLSREYSTCSFTKTKCNFAKLLSEMIDLSSPAVLKAYAAYLVHEIEGIKTSHLLTHSTYRSRYHF